MGLFRMIFRPHDGTRQQVQEEVKTSRKEIEVAVNRFEETIKELLHQNDRLTGRSYGETPPSASNK